MEGLNSFLHYSCNIDFAVYHVWNIRICWELLVLDCNRIFPRMEIENPVSLERMELFDRTAPYQVTSTSSTATSTDIVRKFRPLLRILRIN